MNINNISKFRKKNVCFFGEKSTRISCVTRNRNDKSLRRSRKPSKISSRVFLFNENVLKKQDHAICGCDSVQTESYTVGPTALLCVQCSKIEKNFIGNFLVGENNE